MRISDWSSDVCSSDLLDARGLVQLDDPHADRGLHRMTAVDDDEHIGGRRDGTEQRGAQSSGQPRGQWAPPSGRKGEGMRRQEDWQSVREGKRVPVRVDRWSCRNMYKKKANERSD